MMNSTDRDILEQILQNIKSVDSKVDSLKNRLDSLEKKVDTLQENYDKLSEHIEKVTDHNIAILAENQLELNRKLNTLLEQSDSLSFSMYRTHVTVLTHRVDNLEKEMEILKGNHA